MIDERRSGNWMHQAITNVQIKHGSGHEGATVLLPGFAIIW